MKETISTLIDITDQQYQHLENTGTLKQAEKNEILFRAGTPNRKMLFIEKGLLRAYRIREEHEYTHHFYIENWFATDFKSYLTGEHSDLYIQSLTAATYYEFDKMALLELFQRDPIFEKLGRVIAEQAYLKIVERLVAFQTNNLRERYLRLINQNPELFQKVPQKYIASYLGVAEQSLSRIKSQR